MLKLVAIFITGESEDDVNPPEVSRVASEADDPELRADLDLLDDIRTFVSFGAGVDGRASTEEILAAFGSRLPANDSAKFRAMLRQICDFEKRQGVGMWTLKPDFC